METITITKDEFADAVARVLVKNDKLPAHMAVAFFVLINELSKELFEEKYDA